MEDNEELESFRRQWKEEVARRTQQTRPEEPQPKPEPSQPKPSPAPRFPPTIHEASQRKDVDEEEQEPEAPYGPSEIVSGVEQLHLVPPAATADEDAFHPPHPQKEPTSALEHFERAVQREAEGSLGDSLQHYRKAYRVCIIYRLQMYDTVDRKLIYRCTWSVRLECRQGLSKHAFRPYLEKARRSSFRPCDDAARAARGRPPPDPRARRLVRPSAHSSGRTAHREYPSAAMSHRQHAIRYSRRDPGPCRLDGSCVVRSDGPGV